MNGITPELVSEALRAYQDYGSEREKLLRRVGDNDELYRSWYKRSMQELNTSPHCGTPLTFASIENGVATFSENYPAINILERSPDGGAAADVLSKLIPIVLERSSFRRIYKENVRRKLKYGTGIFIITCDEENESICIRDIDINDIRCDVHVKDIQDSRFLFIDAAVENDELQAAFPDFADRFTGNATISTLDTRKSYTVHNASIITDCYYKKHGKLHLMKFHNNELIAATEAMKGYDNGLYDHGLYPIVFDVLFPEEESPFGFGMIDVCKTTQLTLDKLDNLICENILINGKPRYLCKRNGGIDENEFKDTSKNVVHYEGDTTAIKPIDHVELNGNYLTYRQYRTDELKELAANRDFQQGQTSGGVTAASAIQALQQSGEKRARSMIDDSYTCFKKIIYMVIELIRQFYRTKNYYRIDDAGAKSFIQFSNEELYIKDADGSRRPAEFDIVCAAQKENPFVREQYNNTVLTLKNSGLLESAAYPDNEFVIQAMQFDAKDSLLEGYRERYERFKSEQQSAAQQQAQQQQAAAVQQIVPNNIPTEDMTQNINPLVGEDMRLPVGIPIAG